MSEKDQLAKMPDPDLENDAEVVKQLQGYDASVLLQLGLHEARMQAQLKPLEAGRISIWRAAEDAEVGLRQMIGYAAAHGISPHYDATDMAEERAAW